jgi:superfamily II DNA or RNA helicase
MLAVTQPDVAPLITLRPYQQTCVERVLAAYQQNPKGRAFLVIPTGGGKTIVFTEIARRLKLTTLILAHRQELLEQATDKFHLVDPTAIIGQVGAGRHEWGTPITVASVQTISRPEHLGALKCSGYQLIIVDECHHSASAGYQAVLDALPDAFVIGVTATPDRLDKQSIEHIFGEPVFSASIIDMVEQGFLCDLRAIAVRTGTNLDQVHTQAGDFKQDELEEAIDTPERNARVVTAYLLHGKGRQALCFAVTVAHARHLADVFKEQGVKAAVVSGETPAEERKRLLHDYERGTLEVMCNVGVLSEGYDHPQTSCVIMARPTRSRALYIQSIGRGTRLAPGKRDCVILDITDNCLKHRIEPLALQKALDIALSDGESIVECKEREDREAAERGGREQRERTTRVTQRAQDLAVNVLARMDWQRLTTGTYILEIGEGAQKHTILLVPSEETEGYYAVWARLAPDYQAQQWAKASPLSWATQHAEMKARLLQTDAKKLVLVDTRAAWRAWPVSEKQRFMLHKFAIPSTEGMTSGEASDLIGHAIAERERQRAEKGAKPSSGKRTRRRAVHDRTS